MKPGDLLVSSANTWTSWGIRLGTVSTISHVAMAISSNSVIESTPGGTYPKSLTDFLQDNSKVFLLARPTALTPQEESLLRTSAIGIQRPGYNLPRSLTSGVVRFGFWVWLVSFLFGNINLIFAKSAPWFVVVAYNLAVCFLLLVIYMCARPERFNRAIDKLHLPKFMKTDVEQHFCSQLVFELDKIIQGDLSKIPGPWHELRPKDVERIALKDLGYTRRKLKF